MQDPFVVSLILSAVNFGSTFGGLYILEAAGRRMPLFLGAIWMSIWLFVFAGAGVGAYNSGTTGTGTLAAPDYSYGIGILLIVSACLFIFGYAMTWAPGIWLWVGESFNSRTRAKQAAIATAVNWVANFLISVSYLWSRQTTVTKRSPRAVRVGASEHRYITKRVTRQLHYGFPVFFDAQSVGEALLRVAKLGGWAT